MIQNSKVFVEREVYPEILKWLNQPEIIAINGSRQTGKTTLLFKLKSELKDKKVVYVNFEETSEVESFIKAPKEFISLQLDKNRKTFFLFDEFQYIEKAGEIIKLLYDSFPQAKFIITGSSSLKIRELASFLVGRVVFFTLYPFSFSEYLRFKNEKLFNFWQKFNLCFLSFLNDKKFALPTLIFEKELLQTFEEYLTFGGYPAVATSSAEFKTERLSSLMETYIEKDIIKFMQIGNYLEFKNLVRILATQIGGILNYNSLFSDAHLSYHETRKFLAVLENTFVVKLVSPFFSNRTTEIKKSPKVYLLDLGLRNSLISDFRSIDIRQDKGAVVENFVFNNLLFRKQTSNLNFWRTKQQAEVDFILKYQNEIIPIEVKFQDFSQPKLSRSLLSFCQTYVPKKIVVLTKNYCYLMKLDKTKVLFLPIFFV